MVSVKLIKFLDRYIGYLICLVLSISKVFRSKKKLKYEKILLIQLWGIGETVLTLPTIHTLSQKFKNIDVLTTKRAEEVFYNNKDINNLKVLNLNPFSIKLFILRNLRKYDLVIDMEEYLNISSIITFFVGKERIGYSHGIRSNLYTRKVDYNDKQHVSQTFMDLLSTLGIKTKVSQLLKVNYSLDDKNKVDKLLKNHKIGKKDFLVGLGVGAAESAKSRMWPKERFASLADQLIKNHKNIKIIFVGNSDENELVNDIQNLMANKNQSYNLSGATSLREMFYLISLCKLFIGNDSGPMHVAAAQQVTTIGLFGCNLPVRFKPLGKNNYYIYKKNNQDACINVHKGEVGECKHGTKNACVKKIQVSDVVEIVAKILKKKRK